MIKQQLKQDLTKTIKKLGYSGGFDIVLTIPKNSKFGDYTTNIALQLSKLDSKIVNHSALEIAKQILEKLGHPAYLERVELAGPGFLNFFLKPDFLKKELLEIENNFGENSSHRGQKVLLEHTSVNPNKAMHVGHLRNAIIGDTLARVLRKNGFRVEVQNYIDDTGIQVADTYIGTTHLAELGFREKEPSEAIDDYYWELYPAVNKKYEEDENFKKYREEVTHSVEIKGSQIAKDVKKLAEEIVERMDILLHSFGIYHDLLVWESDILGSGFWDEAFEILKNTPGFEKETEGKNAGTWVVKFGDANEDYSQDKIFVRSNGTTTYTAKDFAYNLWKFGLLKKDFNYKIWGDKPNGHVYSTSEDQQVERNFGHGDYVYTVIDERQSYVQQVIKDVFIRLGYKKQAENFRHIAYGVVSLSANTAKAIGLMLEENKKSYTMSGRKGIGIKVTDLQNLLVVKLHKEKPEKVGESRQGKRLNPNLIAIGAIKYYMLKYNSNSEIAFDLDQALALYGASGPYLQYTHARVFGILEKSKDLKAKDDGYLPNDSERELLKLLFEWPEILENVANSLEPVVISNYAYELAQGFNTFYEKNQVLHATTERCFRLLLLEKFQFVFKDVLTTLGIEAPEVM